MNPNLLVNPGYRIWQCGVAYDVFPHSKPIMTADQWEARVPSGIHARISRNNESRHDEYCMEIYAEPNTVVNVYQVPEFDASLQYQWVTFGIDVKFMTTPRALFMFIEHTTSHTDEPQTSIETYEIKEALQWSRHYLTTYIKSLTPNTNWPNNGGIRAGVMLLADENSARVLVDGASLQMGEATGSYTTLPIQEDLERCQHYFWVPYTQNTIPFNSATQDAQNTNVQELEKREAALAAREAELAEKEAKHNQTKKPISFGESKRVIDL